MTLRSRLGLAVALGMTLCGITFAQTTSLTMAPALTQVFTDDNFQVTGISVSETGRFFVNFPRWSDRYLNAVAEVMPDGSTKPYPNVAWNRWNGKAETAADHFVCVQSVVADGAGSLWAVDAAAPMLGPVVAGGPKLVKIDLATNAITRVIRVGPTVATPDSYLNDIRFDLRRQIAYLTDSGRAGLIVVDLRTGTARRALDGDPSVKVEPGVQVVVDGKPLLRNGKPPQFNADSLALSPDGEYLYYKPVTAVTLYRIRTSVLRENRPAAQVAAVEKFAQTFPTDGLWTDERGDIYLSDVTHNAVTRLSRNKKLERLLTDPRLQWPDTFTQNPNGGAIYVSASHINESPPYNAGRSTRTQPYAVFKFEPPQPNR